MQQVLHRCYGNLIALSSSNGCHMYDFFNSKSVNICVRGRWCVQGIFCLMFTGIGSTFTSEPSAELGKLKWTWIGCQISETLFWSGLELKSNSDQTKQQGKECDASGLRAVEQSLKQSLSCCFLLLIWRQIIETKSASHFHHYNWATGQRVYIKYCITTCCITSSYLTSEASCFLDLGLWGHSWLHI